MPPEPRRLDDPREWLNRARSNLERAQTTLPGVYLEDLCFDAQQAATSREDLMGLPSNRFEALRGDRSGQYSIRINDQWRICFRWSGKGPEDVEIVDYH